MPGNVAAKFAVAFSHSVSAVLVAKKNVANGVSASAILSFLLSLSPPLSPSFVPFVLACLPAVPRPLPPSFLALPCLVSSSLSLPSPLPLPRAGHWDAGGVGAGEATCSM